MHVCFQVLKKEVGLTAKVSGTYLSDFLVHFLSTTLLEIAVSFDGFQGCQPIKGPTLVRAVYKYVNFSPRLTWVL